MANKVKRVYSDTSVIGGLADPEFTGPSRRFLDYARQGIFRLVLSPVVEGEIRSQGTPVSVIDEYEDILNDCEIVEVGEEALKLQQAYIDAGILTPKWEDDALHVALASVNECDIIVSWNFRHIVNFRKIPLYNAVNRLHGYCEIQIYSPLELEVKDEE